jgi:glutamyl-tRNA synthetase
MATPHIKPFIGRLAPSPTGPLHLGNLATFVVAAARARQHNGGLLIRNEDLDRARALDGMFERQLADLDWLGISWQSAAPHEPLLLVQSRRDSAYSAALAQLAEQDLVYACSCSRRDVADCLSAPHGIPDDAIYPGTCAHSHASDAPDDAWEVASDMGHQAYALRYRCAGTFSFHDAYAGPQTWTLTPWHDFVVRRRDGCFAYQLAVVVDDAASGVTDVVRGADLLDSTPRQLALYRSLGLDPPDFAHTPLWLKADGDRLSKRGNADGLFRLREAGWRAPEVIGAIARILGAPTFEQMDIQDLAHALPPLLPGLRAREIRVPDALWDGPRAFRDWAISG